MTNGYVERVRHSAASRHSWDVLGSYDFSIFSNVVDVGGSLGWFVEALLQRYGDTRALLLQHPRLAEEARTVLLSAGLLGRCEIVETDVLCNVSGVGDAYVVPCLLCHCDDAKAVTILSNCRRAMRTLSPLLVIDPAAPRPEQRGLRNQPAPAESDAIFARPRTEAAHQQLLARAGFALSQVVATPGPLSIFEAYPYA